MPPMPPPIDSMRKTNWPRVRRPSAVVAANGCVGHESLVNGPPLVGLGARACSEWNKRAIRRIHHSLILGSTTAICSPSLPTSFFLSFAQCFSFLVLPGRLSVVVRPSAPFRNCDVILPLRPLLRILLRLQSGWGGWPTGNIEKLSNSQVCCLAQLCLAAAYFLPFPVGHPPYTLNRNF